MTKTQQFYERCHELTEFCLSHRPRVFELWPREMVFLYVAWHAFRDTIFVLRKSGKVTCLGFAWPESLSRVAKRHETCQPLFDWTMVKQPDCLLIGEVMGSRRDCGKLYREALRKWPSLDRVFTLRDQKLEELSQNVLNRFNRMEAV